MDHGNTCELNTNKNKRGGNSVVVVSVGTGAEIMLISDSSCNYV